jgi:hypothetical protein
VLLEETPESGRANRLTDAVLPYEVLVVVPGDLGVLSEPLFAVTFRSEFGVAVAGRVPLPGAGGTHADHPQYGASGMC